MLTHRNITAGVAGIVTTLEKVFVKGCLENEDPIKTPRKLEKSKPNPSIWLTLGLKLVFRPRLSQGKYVHPTGNEDVRRHVEHG